MTTAFSFAVLEVKGNTGAAVDSLLKELSVQTLKQNLVIRRSQNEAV
jgi:hypothetical protein